MPFEEEETTGAQLLQRERCDRFATGAAERIRLDEKCLFSLLPHEELSRLAGEWYEACAQAMLRGNYAPIDTWVRSQSNLAAAQGFAPDDLIQLLLSCRRYATEIEGWSEDVFSTVDEVIQEVFVAIRADLPWTTVDSSNYPADTSHGPEASAVTEEWTSERRRFMRNRLSFPIRIRTSGNKGQTEEITRTQSVSRAGLYFVTCKNYRTDQILKINFPYCNEPGGINCEYTAKVVRLDPLQDKTSGVGVDFLESLGPKQR